MNTTAHDICYLLNMKEIWKNIFGYENLYKISNLGRVKSFKGKEKILSVKPSNKGGYKRKKLCKDGIQKPVLIHVLVLKHFGPPKPSECHVADHINEDKSDARIANLRWVTRRENSLNKTSYNRGDIKNPNYSKYRGVWKYTKKDGSIYWQVKCCDKYLGVFHNEKEAAVAYNQEVDKITNKGVFKNIID